MFQQLFAIKSLDTLLAEAEGENRLRRVLGPIGLTSLGIGAIIGAGIFVMTGRVAALDAGPAIILSYVVAGIGCALAALCYAEFASMAPVAGSAYTYAYATLGEMTAWIIGWDLILEYAMSAATVGAVWSKYLNEVTVILFGWKVPDAIANDPFTTPGAYGNLPAVAILGLITLILVVGIRESAFSNTLLVIVKSGVVFFVIAMGAGFVVSSNWTSIPAEERRQPQEDAIPDVASETAKAENPADLDARTKDLTRMAQAQFKLDRLPIIRAAYEKQNLLDDPRKQDLAAREEALTKLLATNDADKAAVSTILEKAQEKGQEKLAAKWGLLGSIGISRYLTPIDDATRSNFMPYGISGVMLGAALVFFAFIGFDSISTHSEEAIRPQRDVPFAIIASLVLCSALYIAVSAIITGMKPYYDIDTDAAVASAFRQRAEQGDLPVLKWSALLIALGGLAGMTSVILITLLSQARIFLAMARDGLLPPAIFGAVHEKFRTPHISTLLTGGVIMVVAAYTPILILEEMVNIGTLFAFVVVCASVLLLRMRNPDAKRPFKTPLIWVVAPLGILVNLTMMLFLTVDSWLRLVIWMAIGFAIYFCYGMWRSVLGQQMRGLIPASIPNVGSTSPTSADEGITRPNNDTQKGN
jgi:APA family basic amino acid/polyamine antiporter